LSRFWELGCGQVHDVEQQRPPQIELAHSEYEAQTAPRGFFALHVSVEQ
jgi:hypothetical protein